MNVLHLDAKVCVAQQSHSSSSGYYVWAYQPAVPPHEQQQQQHAPSSASKAESSNSPYTHQHMNMNSLHGNLVSSVTGGRYDKPVFIR